MKESWVCVCRSGLAGLKVCVLAGHGVTVSSSHGRVCLPGCLDEALRDSSNARVRLVTRVAIIVLDVIVLKYAATQIFKLSNTCKLQVPLWFRK